ncbi:hypothetical protein RJT34_05164 [Clitoria ternatea]|uniref:Uncharacterized protein n=1 Tax=Clitoria ternatea TaxID=43366 RepID=A0AAN9K0S1_CLITE
MAIGLLPVVPLILDEEAVVRWWKWLPEVYKGVEGCWKTEKEGGGTTLDLLQWLPELQRSPEKVVGEKEKQNSEGKE